MDRRAVSSGLLLLLWHAYVPLLNVFILRVFAQGVQSNNDNNNIKMRRCLASHAHFFLFPPFFILLSPLHTHTFFIPFYCISSTAPL